jgi:murein DD-endopeptidase MepM/ murein hydrolase activator NlpD
MGKRGHHQGQILALAFGLMLAACNQSGRPANVPEPVDKPVARVLPGKDMGQIVAGQYVVAPGDTLATVADRTNTPIRTLIDMNHLQPPYAMTPGMRLSLKQRSQYVVQSGDTLQEVAQRFGVTESALVAINNLQTPYKLKAGQTLNLTSTTEASNFASASAVAVPPPTPVGNVSQGALSAPTPIGNSSANSSSGDSSSANSSLGGGSSTMASSALPPPPAAPVPAAPAASAPSISAPKAATQATALPPVQSQTIPSAPTVTAPAAQAKTAEQSAAKAATAPAMPATPTAPVKATANAASAAQSEAQEDVQAEVSQDLAMEKAPAAGSGKGPFVWPVRGKVIQTFGSSTDGLKNDGINIAAPAGSPVVAAADGVVAYAGNELRGFGNMILIRHDGGYVTAYAHNDSLLVKKGDKVKRGQTIARVGATGAVFGPQLHFEIRKGTEPVDPMTYLGG